MVPRRISGPKMAEIIGKWRKLHIEKLRNLSRQIHLALPSQGQWDRYCVTLRGEQRIYGFGSNTWKKEATRKTETYIEERY
jgi:hypothetical protein